VTIVPEQQAFRRPGVALRHFAASHRTELLVAALVFILNISAIRLTTNSSGAVEQWINLTNQMFYGRQDFLFSHGPLYWLVGGTTTPFNVWAYWATVLVLSALSACFWSLIFTLCYNSSSLFLFGLAFFLFFTDLAFPPLLYLWPFAIVAYLEYRDDAPISLRPASLLALGLLVGISFYVRYFYGVIALASFGPYFLSRIVVTKRPWELLLFLAGVVASYVALGFAIFHSRSSILDYIAINNQLSFGNSVDMTLDVGNARVTYIAVTVIAVVLAVYVLLNRRVLFLTIVALLLLLVKLGFSRTDHYIGYFVLPVSVLSLFLLFGTLRTSRIAFVLVMGLLFYLAVDPTYPGAPTRNAFNLPINFAQSYLDRMQALYQVFKLPADVLKTVGNATIDVYPFRNEYMFANRLNYLHRPLFQNYMTLTPMLDAQNEKFFESANRPYFVLWIGDAACGDGCNPYVDVDGKLALDEDPLTTSAILLNYHVVSMARAPNGAPFMLLERNQAHTPYTQSTIGQEDMSFGRWYAVPKNAGRVTKLVPNFAFTTRGRLKNLLFRGGVLVVKYRLASGDVQQFRLNILNSQSGIWVSPFLADFSLAGPEVEAIMIETHTTSYIEPTFHAQWISVPLTAVSTKQVAYDPVLPTAPAAGQHTEVACEGSIDLANGVAARPKIVANGTLHVRGWLAFSTKQNLLPDQTFLTLTDAQGKRLFVMTHEDTRPDVAAFFHHPELSAVGYDALIDLSGLKGAYTLGMAGLYQSHLFTCSQFAIPLDIGG
jgi:hypothetical protein